MNEVQEYEFTESKEEILEEVMNEYGKEVLYIAYSYVKDHSLAEDIAQEVFVRFYQRYDSFRGDSLTIMAGYLKYLCFSLDFLGIKKKLHDLVKQIYPYLNISGNTLGT